MWIAVENHGPGQSDMPIRIIGVQCHGLYRLGNGLIKLPIFPTACRRELMGQWRGIFQSRPEMSVDFHSRLTT